MTHAQLAEFFSLEASNSFLDRLNERELEVFSLISQGNTSRQICQEMGIEPEALAEFKKTIQKKMGLKNEFQLLQFAARQRV